MTAFLDLDVGNSRAKWRLTDRDGTVLEQGVVTNPIQHEPTAIRMAMAALPFARAERVRVSNVAGGGLMEALVQACAHHGLPPPQRATSGPRFRHIRNGYREPERIGVDRWLAVVAAGCQWSGDLVVVDAGSALTVDVLRADGQHLGGYIGPGLAMMARALGRGTDAVQVSPDLAAAGLGPGRATAEAVNGALLGMTMGLIERVVVAQRRRGGGPRVVFAGGDAPVLTRHLAPGIRQIQAPDLVLDGLALILAEPADLEPDAPCAG